jgi:formylglycine-generating enzyme required for sulfatase activity
MADTLKAPVILKNSMPDGSLAVEMVRLSGGTFSRVDDVTEIVGEVEVSEFTMGRYAVTFEQYDRFAKATGRKLPGACGWGRRSRPIMKVSWFDATTYAEWLNDITGEDFRLPTEAEWEYACRAGTKTDYSFGEKITEEQANFDRSNNRTMPVGSYQPNPFGLYEMHGNVWEWCADWYDRYPTGKVKDPMGPDNGKYRVLRGGSWFVNAGLTRSTSRTCDEPGERDHSRGFRLAGAC